MRQELAPGLPADWLNGWLAAIGVTVLLPDVRLSWTGDGSPGASFHLKEDRPLADRLGEALRAPNWRAELAVAALSRKVTRDAYGDAAMRARSSSGAALGWDPSLAASVTDLVWDSRLEEGKYLPHSPFDPTAPGTTGAVIDRFSRCLDKLDGATPNASAFVSATLMGRGARVEADGLGFDARRLAPGVHGKAPNLVDPVVECLCFFGLALFPLRGNGWQPQPRGWSRPEEQRGNFTWPVWVPKLDVWGIDALLDRFYSPSRAADLRRWGIAASFSLVPYRRTGNEKTRAYASEVLPWP
jgi:hypothetical protein